MSGVFSGGLGDVLEGALQSVLNLLKVSWLFSECGIVPRLGWAPSGSAISRRIRV
jgi:hypothetical protein